MAADRIQQAMEAGEKNLRTWKLVQNWCANVKIVKHGGTGIIEMQTGLSIGHHFLECPHAPAGGMAAWDLADTAIDFYDRNGVGCKFRKPVGLPNITILVAERDKQKKAREQEQARQAQVAADRLAVTREAGKQMNTHFNANSVSIDRRDALALLVGAGVALKGGAPLAAQAQTTPRFSPAQVLNGADARVFPTEITSELKRLAPNVYAFIQSQPEGWSSFNWTYFGNAFFNAALRRANNLKDAYLVARSLVLKRELREGFEPSHPQMAGGGKVEPLLVARPSGIPGVVEK
jgi:hypothetical protein